MDAKNASLIILALGATIALPVSLHCLRVGGDVEAQDEAREWMESMSPWRGTN